MTARNTTELTDTEMDAVLDKLAKIMALTTSPSEGEATAAAEMAQKLLFKYNLSMTQVDARKQATNAPRDIRERYTNNSVDLGVARGQVTNWRRDLMFSLARNNFCRALQWKGLPTMQLIGQPHNVEVVMEMFAYLTEAIDGLSLQAWEQAKAENGGKAPLTWHETPKVYGWHPQHAKQYRSSFSHGAVARIAERLYQMRQALRDESAASKALVVIVDQELNDAVSAHYSSVSRTAVARVNVDTTAYNAGKRAGDKIGLDKQVKSGKQEALNA